MSLNVLTNNLKHYRLQSGMTQKQVSDYLKCPVATYSRYENNKRKVSIETAYLLCRLYGISMDRLFFLWIYEYNSHV